MRKIIKVSMASDGLVITFDEGSICYYPAEALYAHQAEIGAHTFVDQDSSLASEPIRYDVPPMRVQ